MTFSLRSHQSVMLLITLLAFGLRLWQQAQFPPGWRDDELINSLVISQKALDGDVAVYYADASGHEALYHLLNAVMLGLFGANVIGIRFLSVILGTLTVPLTFVVGKRLFGSPTGLMAAATLAVSFWALMYARIGLRHILMPPLTLLTFYLFWQGLRPRPRAWLYFLGAAGGMGLGFYTYFASRGVPLILGAFVLYLWLFARRRLQGKGRGIFLMFGAAGLLALPLLLTLRQQPLSEARVAELAVPLVEARAGNLEPLWHYTLTTLKMFHSTGDGEWLYNIPNRPILGPIGAIFFWSGVLLALGYGLRSLARWRQQQVAAAPYIFLLFWWLAGISPAFISVPPASLGHTILAQPATFILAALPLGWAYKMMPRHRLAVVALLGTILVMSVMIRDLPDYFQGWSQRGMVRFLYRADIGQVADYVNENRDLTDFGITGLLAGPWDKVAFSIDLAAPTAVRPRWYHPERVILVQPAVQFYGFPDVPHLYQDAYTSLAASGLGGYRLGQVDVAPVSSEEQVCFVNGLCWLTADYQAERPQVDLTWQVQRRLDLPPMPLISNPPPPGVYAGPRLAVFVHLLDADGQFLAGDDGLWIDPTTLYAGDIFIQQHRFTLPPDTAAASLAVGLYDPMTGERILTEGGQDQIEVARDQ